MLDTNIAIALLRAEPHVVERWSSADHVVLPAPVLAELLYGARRSGRPAENEERVLDLARAMEFVVCDQVVCRRYASLKAALSQSGRPIPNNDLWIAACCLAANATLVTRDAHFVGLPELVCEEW